MLYLLDTNIIIDSINGKLNRPQLLDDLVVNGKDILACCPVNVIEVYAGMRPAEQEPTDKLLQSLAFLPITLRIARLAGLLKRDYSKKGHILSLADATIAAVVIENKCALITDNVKDFPMKGLQIHTFQ